MSERKILEQDIVIPILFASRSIYSLTKSIIPLLHLICF